MPLISSSIPNLINGISQQPAALRLASQAERAINTMPSPVEGLKKRPPFQHIKKILSGSAGSGRPFFRIVDRDSSIRYLVMIRDQSIKVFDLDGTEKTVNTPDGVSYLDIGASSDPSTAFRMASVVDYSFIVNREKVAAMAADLSPQWGTKGMVFIKSAEYSTTYRIKVNATEVSYTTAAAGGTVPDTVTIASSLASSLSSALGAGWTITSTDYIVRITKNDGGDYTLGSSDTKTGDGTIPIKGTVDTLSDLPTIAEHGFTVKIQGTQETKYDDYYVKFSANAGSGFGPGIWKETVAPGIAYKLDAATMPHVLVRENNGTFTFKKFTWGDRVAGDATTAKNPSFIGSSINNLTLFRNRLVLLADENVIMSASDAYERFFPETVQTVVDSDPIDLSTGGAEVNILLSAIPFATTLLLFSRHGQFRLDAGSSAGTVLTPRTANITQMTAYESISAVDPIVAGRTIYMPIPRDEYIGVRELYLPETTSPIPVSEEITSSAPRYVPGNLCTFITTVSEEAIVAISKSDPKRIYLYKFFFQEETRLQSAWSHWEVSGNKTVIGAVFLDSDLYLIAEYTDGVYLEKAVIRPENVDTGTSIELLVDRKTTEASCTVALTTPAGLDVQSTITLPYPINPNSTMVVVGRYFAGNTVKHGQVIYPISQTLTGGAGGNGTLTVRGNLTSAKFYVGELYTMLYEFSTQYLKEQPPGGGMAVIGGPRLQLRTWSMIFDQTSAFMLNVTPRNRTTNTYPYNGIEPGDQTVLLGSPGIRTSKFRVPVMAQNIDVVVDITSDSPLPCRFQSAEWEGWYHTRAQRL